MVTDFDFLVSDFDSIQEKEQFLFFFKNTLIK